MPRPLFCLLFSGSICSFEYCSKCLWLPGYLQLSYAFTYLIKLSTLVNCLKYTHMVIQPLSLKTYDMPCKFLPPNKIPLHTYTIVSINANYSPTGAICYQKLGYRRNLQHRGCQQVEAISIKISLKVIN